MNDTFDKLKTILREIAGIESGLAVLGWDQQTYMPEGAAEDRGNAMSTLATLAHNRFVSEEVGRLLEELEPRAKALPPDSDEARLQRVTARRYRKETRVPAELVAELARVTVAAHQAWEKARSANDFPSFRPHLEKVFELRRTYAGLFRPFDHVYDPLLDDYEPGLKTAEVKAIFDALRPEQVELIRRIGERPQVDDSFLRLRYDERKQIEFSTAVAGKLGYDWRRGRMDKAAHPFTTSFGIGDVRITTRVLPDYLPSCLFATMHEAGHALYEQGVARELEHTPLAGGASLAIHESQSRMWENLVGRSLAFWEHLYPVLQGVFPTQLGSVGVAEFYRAVNRVQPSLIRVEADEATYNLHIMLRLEIEIGVLEGSIAVRDLPEVWRSRMKDYLGVTPPDDARGVLQDVHWSGGMVGYFPTYALGNLVSAQLWERIAKDLPDLEQRIRRGDLASLLSWLRENIHRHGAKLEPQELVRRVTGRGIEAAPYLRYLRSKLGSIYGL